MKIYFSPIYTSRAYTRTLPLGSEICNLEQLVQLIELHSGIHYPEYGNLELQVKYMQALMRMDCEHPENVVHRSLQVDPISTARTYLEWRDLLVLAGWNTSIIPSKRIEAMALAEPYFKVKTISDRIVSLPSIIEKSGWLKGIEMEVQFDEKLMHPATASIIEALREAGVAISYPKEIELDKDCNLKKFRDWMKDGKISPDFSKEDQTLKVYTFKNRQHVLRHIMSLDPSTVKFHHWISRQGPDIDQALRAGGKVTSGSYMSKSLPPIVQLLPLAISRFIEPVDLNKLIAWLRAPRSPLSSGVRFIIANLLLKEGGWDQKKVNETIENYFNNHPEQYRKQTEANLKQFAFLPENNIIGKEDFIKFMKNFQTWAQKARKEEYKHELHSQFDALLNRISAILILAENEPYETIEVDTLHKWEKLVNETGNYEMYPAASAGPIICSCAGDMIGDSDNAVWIGFSSHNSFKGLYSFLSLNEKKELLKKGCRLYNESDEMKAKKIIDLWVLSHTRSLTIIEMEQKEPNEIRSSYSQQWNSLPRDKRSIITILAPTPETKEIQPIGHFDSQTSHINIDNGQELKWRKRESFSSISLLIQDPCEYVLKYQLGLYPPKEEAVNVDNASGNVAHIVIQTLFRPGLNASEISGEYERNFDVIFNETISRKGMILMLPENQLVLKNLRNNLKRSVVSLIDFFDKNDFITVGCEEDFARALFIDDDVELGGFIDMHLKTSHDCHAIIDLKWSMFQNKFEEKVKEGTDLQLDIYSWLLSLQFGNIKSTFYVMPANRFFTHHDLRGSCVKRLNPEHDVNQMIERMKSSYKYRKGQISNGIIEVALGFSKDEIQYCKDEADHNLYPLHLTGGCKTVNSYSEYLPLFL